MAQAVVTIAGRAYRMSCDEGEQGHIEGLAQSLEAKIGELRGAFGEIGDQRIVVMAALTIADELHAARKHLAEVRDELAAARAEADTARLRQRELAEGAAKALEKAAVKVAAATKALDNA